MDRRRLLGALGAGAASVAGCVSPGSSAETTRRDETGTSVAAVDDPPEWLQQRADCDYATATLALSERTATVHDRAVVVPYGQLSEDSKVVVRFAVHHGSAETCTDTGAAAFSRLLSDLTDGDWKSYLEEHRERPPATAIRTAAGYYVLSEMRVYDGVLY